MVVSFVFQIRDKRPVAIKTLFNPASLHHEGQQLSDHPLPVSALEMPLWREQHKNEDDV
jgi:hypothetical protein